MGSASHHLEWKKAVRSSYQEWNSVCWLEKPLQFRFFIISRERKDEAGDLVENAEEELEELASLEVCLEMEDATESQVVPVQLRTLLTEVGALELWCEKTDGSQQWKLEFNLRNE